VPHIILHMSYGRNPVFRKNSIPGNDIQTWKDICILVNLLQFKGHVQDAKLAVSLLDKEDVHMLMAKGNISSLRLMCSGTEANSLILQVLDLLRNSLQCDLAHNVSGAT